METLSHPVQAPASAEQISEAAVLPSRESVLRSLLDGPYASGIGNYEYARDTGLFDVFVYNPQKGEDGLLHTLAGETVTSPDGKTIPQGFHHEPSADYGSINPGKTMVDREHMTGLNSKERAEFVRHPFNPYKAKTYVDGLKKTMVEENEKAGSQRLIDIKSGMFPLEYDALAVMQAVKIARDTRDQTNDHFTTAGTLKCEGCAPMLDGESLLRIRLILDPVTEQVITAIPLVKLGGFMKLADESIQMHLGLL